MWTLAGFRSCPVHENSIDESAKRALDALHEKGLNFDIARRSEFTEENGWHIDDYSQRLPAESPGPPVADGSWSIARGLIRDYEFADPAIIRTIYYANRPLEQRDMLMEARFYGLRFYFGCRVGGVNDEIRAIEGRRVHVWGWNYRTLQGHLEMGQMDFEVWKWPDSGEVEFRIHVVSKPAYISNPLIRLGFWLFGRPTQIRFARRACKRMAFLTAARLGDQTVTPRRLGLHARQRPAVKSVSKKRGMEAAARMPR
jgi:uncharacterized protein (UPF0548 family)